MAAGDQLMRSLVFQGPGELEWLETEAPTLEADGDALVRPIAATTCDLDRLILQGAAPFAGPLALGHECVAEVVEVGPAVTGARRGDVVVVPWHVSCWRCDRCRRGVPTSCRQTPGAMYGLPVAGDWGSTFSDLLRVPHAEGALVPVPPGIAPTAVASAADNLPAAWEVTAPHLARAPESRALVMGGSGSIGLYAVAFAGACGASRVDYVDDDPERLAIAERLGARTVSGPPPDRMEDDYFVTVDATAHDPAGLACALRSVEPEGFCSTVGIYFQDVPVPMFEMYLSGVSFHAGKSNARPAIPAVLDLVSAGRVDPTLVTTEIFDWDEAPHVLADPPLKPVFWREPIGTTDSSAAIAART